MDSTGFATVEDLAAFWRVIETGEEDRATFLLNLASDRLRLMGEDLGIDLDDKVANSLAFKSTMAWVVMEAVKRALQTPTDALPVDNYSQTAGPYSENYKFSNPSGDLWFKKAELAALGLYGKQTLDSISMTTADIFS